MHNSYWLHQTSRSSFGYCSLYSSLKMLGLIHALTYCFCTVECLLLYFILFKLEYALPAWNIMTTNANKQECSLSLRHFFLIFLTVMLLQLRTVQVTRHQFDALFLLFVFFQDLNFILPWLIIVVSKFLLVMLEISPSVLQDKNCPSTRCCKFGMQWYRYIE